MEINNINEIQPEELKEISSDKLKELEKNTGVTEEEITIEETSVISE